MAKTELTIPVVLLIAVLVVGGLGAWYLFNKTTSGQTITSAGTAEMTVAPDKAIVYLLIQTKSSSAENAKNDNAQITENVMNALKAIGIKTGDIETENYNIYPDYDYPDYQKIKGYTVSNNIKISSANFTEVGKIVDASVDAGALVSYINFDLSLAKQNEYKKIVLANATQDAKAKAEAIASGLGKSLGSLVSVSTSDYNYYPYPLYAMAEGGGADVKQVATNIQPRNLDITAGVSVVYRIR